MDTKERKKAKALAKKKKKKINARFEKSPILE